MTSQFNYLLYNQEDRARNRYAVVILLPPHLDEVIASLREKYDPLYNAVASHVTLVFPFESERSLDEIAGIIKMVTDDQPAMPIELDSIGDYYPDNPVIYWKVKPNADLVKLYFRLYSDLGLPPPYREYQPHVTVAREISHHRVVFVKDKIVSYLPRERFMVRAVDLISPMVGNRWVSVRTFALYGPGLPALPQ